MEGHYAASASRPLNKGMKLTKLRAVPVRQAEVPPCAPAGTLDGGTASQLIPGVGRTWGEPAWRGTRLSGGQGECGQATE